MKVLKRLATRGTMFGDVAQTSLVGMIVMVLTIVAQGIAARVFTADELSAYLMIRKANLALVPLAIMGMSMALSRHLPMFAGQGRAGRRQLATVTMGLVFLLCIVFVTLIFQFKASIATLLFRDPQLAHWIPGLAAYLAGTVCVTIVSAYFLGRMWMKLVNLMQFVAIGMVQLIVLLAMRDAGLGKIVETMGLSILGVGLFFLIFAVSDALWGDDKNTGEPVPAIGESFSRMLRYGLPRVPAFLAMSGLWLISPLLVVQLSDLGSSRYMVTALNLLSFAAVPFKPMTVVFFPRFAEMKTQGRFEEMSRLASFLTDSLVQLGILGATQIALFVPILLRVWMEFTDPKAYLLATIISIAIPAYLVFEVLRNPIDSFTPVPMNTYTITGSLGLLVVLSWVFTFYMDADLAVAWATCIAFLALGAATFIVARKMLIQPGTIHGNRGYLSFLVVTTLLYPAGVGVKSAIQGLGDVLSLGAIALWAVVVLVVFGFVQVKLGVVWATQLKDRIGKKP